MSDLQIRPLDPTDEAHLQAGADLVNATYEHDCPWRDPVTVAQLRQYYTQGWDGDPDRPFGGWLGDDLVVLGEINLPTHDNLDSVWVYVVTRPEHRRQGHGTAMLRHLEAEIARSGRTKVGSFGMDQPATMGFAQRHGFVPKSPHILRRQDLTTADWTAIETAHAQAAAAAGDYEVLRLAGPIPDELIEAAVELVSAINDAPLDDLDYDDEQFSVERLRAYEQSQLSAGYRLYRVVARHRESGALAGHSVVTVDSARPHIGDQHDTSVVSAHRGHRLGLLLKADMLQWLREAEPALERITTGNAESNTHMIAVNERLGYQVLERRHAFQREAATTGH